MPDFSAMPEVFVSNADLAAAVSREVKGGTLRKIGSRLYTRNLKDAPEQIVLRNLWPLVAAYLPGALIADRTALEYRPAPDGSVFLVADRQRQRPRRQNHDERGTGCYRGEPNYRTDRLPDRKSVV